MCERPVRHRLLQQRAFEDGVSLSVRQLLEVARLAPLYSAMSFMSARPQGGSRLLAPSESLPRHDDQAPLARLALLHGKAVTSWESLKIHVILLQIRCD
jgi:hypothetical protein